MCRDDQQATAHPSSASNKQELQIATLRLTAMTRRVLPAQSHSLALDQGRHFLCFLTVSVFYHVRPCRRKRNTKRKQGTGNRNRIMPHRTTTRKEPTFPVATDSFIHQTTNVPWHQISLIKHVAGFWCAFSCKHVQAQDFSEFSAVALSAV